MILIVECMVICILFSIVILIPLHKNSIGQIMSYPRKIRERVEILPQYKDHKLSKINIKTIID